eukprot:1107438-Karenia_brevis.AAC.1
MIDKHECVSKLVTEIFMAYTHMHFPGTNHDQGYLGTVEPTPVPGAPGRKQQKHIVPPLGP